MLHCLHASTGERIDDVALDPSTTIGRASSSNLVLGWDGISRRHCQIDRFEKQQGSAWRLTDICEENRGNGVYVNNRKVRQCVLKHEDVISFGRGQEIAQGSSISTPACIYHFKFLVFKKNTPLCASRATNSLACIKANAETPCDTAPLDHRQVATNHPRSILQAQASMRPVEHTSSRLRYEKNEARKEQSLLTEEIGLVGCGRDGKGARKGAAVRGGGRLQDLALAGGHSAFGFVSEQLAQQHEARNMQRTTALQDHRAALLLQAASDRRRQAEERRELALIRQLENEKLAGERRRREELCLAKREELQGAGVPPHILRQFFPDRPTATSR